METLPDRSPIKLPDGSTEARKAPWPMLLFITQNRDSKGYKKIQEKILTGRIDKFFAERVLLEQGWIKEDSTTVEKALIAALGEGTRLEAYSRFQVGA